MPDGSRLFAFESGGAKALWYLTGAVEAVEEDCDLVIVEAKSPGYMHEQHESLFAWALSPLSKLPTSTACSSVERSGV